MLVVVPDAHCAPLRNEGACGRERLDAMIVGVEHEYGAIAADRDAVRTDHLTVAGAGGPPRGHEGAGRCELQDAVVVGIDDVDIPVTVDGDAVGRGAEAPVAGRPFRDEGARRRELLDTPGRSS